MRKKEKILNKIIELLKSIKYINEMYLFGSKVNNKVKKDSDWDLLILIDNDISFNVNEKVIIDKMYDLEIETGEIISPLIYTKFEWYSKYLNTPLYNNISKNSLKLI